MVEQTLLTQARALRQFELHAYVIMPNHVHLLLTPLVKLPDLTAQLQSLTAKRANELLELQGAPFWSAQDFEHLVGTWMERDRIQLYIEQNPVRAGLASTPAEYAYSSAGYRRGAAPHQLAAAC
jgi:REP element-mobilizing transposase RayT